MYATPILPPYPHLRTRLKCPRTNFGPLAACLQFLPPWTPARPPRVSPLTVTACLPLPASRPPELYTRTGLLTMATRNMGVKTAPERWQDNVAERFDVVVTFEQGVFDRVLEGEGGRGRLFGPGVPPAPRLPPCALAHDQMCPRALHASPSPPSCTRRRPVSCSAIGCMPLFYRNPGPPLTTRVCASLFPHGPAADFALRGGRDMRSALVVNLDVRDRCVGGGGRGGVFTRVLRGLMDPDRLRRGHGRGI